tara:strand:+ start:102 stop:359 length:258 start_codon:yes stop_codon:yes gene_type:complete
LEFRDRLHQRYDELFVTTGESIDTSAAGGFSNKWGWTQSIYQLANSDITKFEDVTKLNVNFCLTMLEFKKEKSEVNKTQINKNFK